jgi:hypothetical protein
MIRALEVAKTVESVNAEIVLSILVHSPAVILRALRRDHSSPTITSAARVMANRVKSMVRPANLDGLELSSLDNFVSDESVGTTVALFFDCNSWMLSHPAMNVESHLVSLILVREMKRDNYQGYKKNPKSISSLTRSLE